MRFGIKRFIRRISLLLICGAVLGVTCTDAAADSLKADTKQVFRLAGRGFVHQFTYAPARNTLLIGGLGTGAIAFADNAILREAKEQHFWRRGVAESLGDEVTVAVSFLPLATYAASRYLDDATLRAFSLETLGSLTLAYAETVVISQLPTHRRPRHDLDVGEGGNFFDDALRGTYSFPSGHIVGPATLALKTYDYYGWRWALLPAALTVVSGISRVSTEHHYPSDIVSGLVLALSAHLATRSLAGGEDFRIRVSALPERGVMLSAGWEF